MIKLPPQFQKWFHGGLSLVLLLTLGSSGLILCHSLPGNAASIWQRLNYPLIILSCMMAFFSWVIEACRIWLIANGLGERITLGQIFKINMATSFIGNITPFYSGSVPTQIYLLNQSGVQAGKASAIVTLRLIISTLFFTLFAPILLFSYHQNFSFGSSREITLIAIPISVVISVLLIIFILRPKLAQSFITFLLKLIPPGRFSQKIQPSLTKFLDQLEIFHHSIREFRKAYHFYLVILATLCYWICFFSIAPLLMQAFGVLAPGMYPKLLLLQFILFFIIAYIPVPGGSGIMEVGLFSLLNFVPLQLRALLIISWRFLSYHLSTFVGGMVLLHMINHRPAMDFPS